MDNFSRQDPPFENLNSDIDSDSYEGEESALLQEEPEESNYLPDKSTSDLTGGRIKNIQSSQPLSPSVVDGTNCLTGEVLNNNASGLESNSKILETVEASKEIEMENEPLGIVVNPCTSEQYESVETITIDANQRTQDDDDVTSLCKTSSDDYNDDSATENKMATSKQDDWLANKNTNEFSTIVIVKLNSSEEPEHNVNTETAESKNQSDDNNQVNAMSLLQNTEDSNNQKNANIKYLKKLEIFSNLTGSVNSSSDDCLAEEKKLNCVRYNCRGCDKIFWILRFYYQHIARTTTTILYHCKACKKKMKFTNPCLLKIHMKSHGHSLDNIKIGNANLKLGLPSLNQFMYSRFLNKNSKALDQSLSSVNNLEETVSYNVRCPECQFRVPSLVEHLMYVPTNNGLFGKCPVCVCIFSSKCAFEIHKRIHFMSKPYCCPECGMSFVTHSRLLIHLFLECYHFCRCLLSKCLTCGAILSDMNMLKNHIILKHRSVVYKCSFCPRLFRLFSGFKAHMKNEHDCKKVVESANIYIKCEVCPAKSKVFSQDEFSEHLSNHLDEKTTTFFGFRCKKCKYLTQNPVLFQNHMEKVNVCRLFENIIFKRNQPSIAIPLKKRKCEEYNDESIQKRLKRIYTIHQPKCDTPGQEVQRISHALDDTINIKSSAVENMPNTGKMMCLLCDKKFNDATSIRNHITTYHKCSEHHKYIKVFLNLKEVPTKNKMEKLSNEGENKKKDYKNGNGTFNRTFSNNKTSSFGCPYCEKVNNTLEEFRMHVVEHREDGAYQCLECGECFVCKNPLEIHLVSAHSIKDPGEYISSHFVHNSLPKPCGKPDQVQPNQCSVCFDIFPDDKALQLHFRSHGMAFLRQNFAKRITT